MSGPQPTQLLRRPGGRASFSTWVKANSNRPPLESLCPWGHHSKSSKDTLPPTNISSSTQLIEGSNIQISQFQAMTQYSIKYVCGAQFGTCN